MYIIVSGFRERFVSSGKGDKVKYARMQGTRKRFMSSGRRKRLNIR